MLCTVTVHIIGVWIIKWHMLKERELCWMLWVWNWASCKKLPCCLSSIGYWKRNATRRSPPCSVTANEKTCWCCVHEFVAGIDRTDCPGTVGDCAFSFTVLQNEDNTVYGIIVKPGQYMMLYVSQRSRTNLLVTYSDILSLRLKIDLNRTFKHFVGFSCTRDTIIRVNLFTSMVLIHRWHWFVTNWQHETNCNKVSGRQKSHCHTVHCIWNCTEGGTLILREYVPAAGLYYG